MKILQQTIIIIAIALVSVIIFDLVEQNSALRDQIETLEATRPQMDELQRRRDAADKDLATLRAQIIKLERTPEKRDR